ncbi:MAG: radical SAM protein [Bacilli bacterium]|nr:radical SAM protein [Bacilli bacterium]
MRINSVKYNNSLVDGPGIRTIVFFQGCDIHCKGCQNASTWNPNLGMEIEVDDLVEELNKKVFNKKVTISGGEPLMQKEALMELVEKLHDDGFEIALYTGHSKKDVPIEIIKKIKYLKTGRFEMNLKTGIKPFVGSSNQEFEEVDDETIK